MINHRFNPWPEAHLAEVKRRWSIGESASTIAKAFRGRTRVAVIGIVHRQGWQSLGREAVGAPASTPVVAKARTAPPKPGPQKKTPVAFGFVPAQTHAEAEQKREAAAVAGAQHIRGFHFPANDDAVLLIRREFGQCSWPVGDPVRPADQLCCGQPVIGERTKSTATYCDRHRRIAAPGGVPVARDLIRSVRRAA